jgi:hypothetical protein
MPSHAEQYVKLVLAVGEHDESYVDAYYGPPELRQQVEAAPPTLDRIAADARALIAGLDSDGCSG